MAVDRRIAALTRDSLDELALPCRSCVRWELDAVARSRAEAEGSTAQAKQDWLSRTLLDWGSCGQVVRAEGAVVGYALYAPPAYLPGLAAYATAPVSPDAVALAALHIDDAARGHGLARLLVQAMTADLARRGVRAVEAVASQSGDDPCLVPAGLLLALGFTTVRPHPRHPRLRLDLRATAAWREDVVEAALERLLGRPLGALHRDTPQ
ncbi:MAG: GNAT family N-acetyltransferase [Actinobacteria bacterium]|nr:GNAT family N-acetyltransferase [Actinomycetota bacterium]